MEKGKLLGEQRRDTILGWIKGSEGPIPARVLAEKAKVSRQVIVQDISLLKAKNEPILATAQGYVYLRNSSEPKPQRVIACYHTPQDTEKELTLIVDHGATILDVIVEHPMYGQLTASLMISSRQDVKHFLKQIQEKKASLLSELTEGVHLHTLQADTTDILDEVCAVLEQEGILLSDTTTDTDMDTVQA
ncbi:transcription repressor NadR [Bacillus horti]|uniref:Transcriptional regulator of NAD metabolism n=1 Tax=Caldalkalibacillus horti TaxID=77523 RepID=A0ABT9VVT5_9BACI|nr:transcription repressor NadR [Bacillus horti]MDQ0165074.1 transcriptional regulator of NAD metabolism [Bacillus horti]